MQTEQRGDGAHRRLWKGSRPRAGGKSVRSVGSLSRAGRSEVEMRKYLIVHPFSICCFHMFSFLFSYLIVVSLFCFGDS